MRKSHTFQLKKHLEIAQLTDCYYCQLSLECHKGKIKGRSDHLGLGLLVDDVGFELEESHALPEHVHPLHASNSEVPSIH